MAAQLEDSYRITVQSPCTGSIDVERQSDTQYTGSSTGVFGSAALIKLSGGGWMIVAFASDSSSPCHPVVVFDQDTPDDSPVGNYTQRNGSGTATVTQS